VLMSFVVLVFVCLVLQYLVRLCSMWQIAYFGGYSLFGTAVMVGFLFVFLDV
jgi:hypothetical protein